MSFFCNGIDFSEVLMSAGDDKVLWDESRLANPHVQSDKADRVRGMFDAIAPTYELINRVFSGGRDAAWRRAAVGMAGVTSNDAVLDVACGTGDFARAFRDGKVSPRSVVGTDFAMQMLTLAAERDRASIGWLQSDAQSLPFSDGSFSVVSCAFGVRNFQKLSLGLREMCRVLGTGGRAIILEFSRPQNRVMRSIYEFYSSRIMPIGATLVSGDRTGAYRYLPKSVVSFPSVEAFVEKLREAGFDRVETRSLTMGVVTVYAAYK